MAIKASITIIEGDHQGQSLTLTKQKTYIGRSRGDFVIADRKVSSEHCCLTIEDDKLFIEDLASTNGTFVNEVRINDKVELKNLDEVTVGFAKCRIAIVESLESFREENVPSAEELLKKKPKSKQRRLEISDMIEEELKRFSRWDIVQQDEDPSFGQGLAMPKVNVTLKIIAGPEMGRVIELDKGNMTLGRSKADVKFRDTDVSRNHASIEIFSANQIQLRDLASTNGTYLNKKRITYTKLNDGDEIQIGSTLMKISVKEV